MRARGMLGLMMLLAGAGCGESPMGTPDRRVLEPNFQSGTTDGWTVQFADLPAEDVEIYELESGIRPLPAPLDTNRKALFVSGHNRSDDLFMFMTREVTGLAPGGIYDARFELQIATNAGSGCVGIGGAPGEAVYVKVGATGAEPRITVGSDGWRRVNFDKGNQAPGGSQVVTIGDVANGSDQCGSDAPYRLKRLSSAGKAVSVTADAQGRIWLVVGTDSGFEGKTSLYYPSIRVTLTRPTI